MAAFQTWSLSEFLRDTELLKQGAEARLYRSYFLDRPTIVKERFNKRYRHPALDDKLSHRRTLQEVRSILRCRRAGELTPVAPFKATKSKRVCQNCFNIAVVHSHYTNEPKMNQANCSLGYFTTVTAFKLFVTALEKMPLLS